MRIEDRLSDSTKERLNKIRRRKRNKKRPVNNNPLKKEEKLSEWDVKELMGMNRTRYERRGGAIRRK